MILKYIKLILLVSFFSFTTKNDNYQATCISIDTNGFVELQLANNYKGIKYSENQSKKDAIHCLLFSSVKGSSCNQTLLLDTEIELANFKKIEKTFFSKNGIWKTFVKSTVATTNKGTYNVFIAKNDLRKYLESKQIITPLNNGF